MRNNYFADILILGGGIAAVTAAQTAREANPGGSVIMLSNEMPILRPLLSKAGFAGIGKGKLSLQSPEWFEEQAITFVQTEILKLDPVKHEVETGDGIYTYKKCIYALGSEPFVPPFPGADLPGVCAVRRMSDLVKIKERTFVSRKAVIIGGGVIGIESGEMLAGYGVEVTILESLPYLLPRILDPETAAEYQKRLTRCRVETGITVSRICGETEVEGVELADGRFFPCGLVIVSCGVRANAGIARDAGLTIERGVVVNEKMETSAADVYACGDCAQYNGFAPALWETAIAQGRAAAENACGIEATYSHGVYPVTFYAPGASLFALGDLKAEPAENVKIVVEETAKEMPYLVTKRNTASYRRLVYKDGQLIGAALIGDLSDMARLRGELGEKQ